MARHLCPLCRWPFETFIALERHKDQCKISTPESGRSLAGNPDRDGVDDQFRADGHIPLSPGSELVTPYRRPPCSAGRHQACLFAAAIPVACDCARRDHAEVAGLAAKVILPNPVPAPTVTMANPAWTIAILDVGRQLATAAGDAVAGKRHFIAAEQLLAGRRLGQSEVA